MVSVIDELKEKLTGIGSRINDLRSEIAGLEEDQAALMRVIGLYDPNFTAAMVPAKRKRTPGDTPSRRVTELLKGRNNRHLVLDILRRAGRAIATAEIADQFAQDIGFDRSETTIVTAIGSRFSATLDGLLKQGLVRQAGTVDGRRHRWEIDRQDGAIRLSQT